MPHYKSLKDFLHFVPCLLTVALYRTVPQTIHGCFVVSIREWQFYRNKIDRRIIFFFTNLNFPGESSSSYCLGKERDFSKKIGLQKHM